MAYLFETPPTILFGAGALEQAQSHLAHMGRKALVVSGPHACKNGDVARVRDMLAARGVESAVFDGVTGEPTLSMVAQGAEMFRGERCDFLVAIGGGSPLDAMKAIAVTAVSGKPVSEFLGQPIRLDLPPMAAIPTTAGTGSEATHVTIITDESSGVKMLLAGPCLMPQLAVVDPTLTLSCPPGVTAATGLDALTHAIEAYTSRKAQPMTDRLSLSAVSRIFQNLPVVYRQPDNMPAREEMALAALEAGMAFGNASVTIVHGMSRPIGALFHVPHGMSNAMLLPACLEFALAGTPKRFAALYRAAGGQEQGEDRQLAGAFVQQVSALCREMEIPTPIEFGIDKEAFLCAADKMADDALASGSPANTRRLPTKEDILAIYRGLVS